ncbi:dentin sialophosphoprotein-like isoform X2 [Leptopilina heterotoma]|uniref:dentin sialophosphoprotein-like isoform X2 n=1 Tax=Leptopilina heterotoma TaxID=63436 RepID=UPI001CA8B1B3|nr:dentin sialophosphoprotein-like isoform X2 [Leptopilina heterotoma]
MTTATSGGGGASGGGVGGALSLMGCVREASPTPVDQHPLRLRNFQHSVDALPKEPKKRRFHPLRGLRRIFRRKSRGAADSRLTSGLTDGDLLARDREEVTLRHPGGRTEEARSRSASELLTDSCDRESVFLRRNGEDDSFTKFRGGAGQLSVSHDSVFPGEVPHTRPLSLESLTTLERRQSNTGDEAEHNREYKSHVAQRQRISLRVLEQIKTVIENRNHQASTTSTDSPQNRFGSYEIQEKSEDSQTRVTRTIKDSTERIASTQKEDLPQLETASLNHTAAHHRISVRPKNRRPPKRNAVQNGIISSNIPPTINESSDTLDSLELISSGVSSSNASSPVESKNVSILRKSSSRLSRNSDIFEELEAKLPRKPSSVISLSPDSLDSTPSRTFNDTTGVDSEDHSPENRSITRRPSNRTSKGSDILEKMEIKLPRRRSSSNRLSKSPDSLENSLPWFSKSTEGFDKLVENEETKQKSSTRRFLNPISKSIDRVSKSSDSLEVIDALTSDDSIERRRSSFDFRPRRSAAKVMSKSTENFEALGHHQKSEEIVSLQKRCSASDINLSRDRRTRCKLFSESTDSFDRLEAVETKPMDVDVEFKKNFWRSSESSDNPELDEIPESRRVRRPPKRIPSKNLVDSSPIIAQCEERRPTPVPKPRLQKSSESSELGSTDTLGSDRRNKSSDSTETLDSLEKDLEQDRRENEIMDNATDRGDKSDPLFDSTSTEESANADGNEENNSVISNDKSYWRQSSESKENLDIHQLLAITIVTQMASDNGNNQRGTNVFLKKNQTSPPTSPLVKPEDNKMLFNNLLSNKNDEDLQNMLNGNISEVSTDTKSFKEKLIMFERLGK